MPSIQLKTAALVPIPRVRQTMARVENAGLRRSIRKPKRKSCAELVRPIPDALFARDFFALLDAAKFPQGRVSSFGRRHTGGNVSLGQKIEMVLDFLRHLLIAPILAKQSENRENQARSRGINCSGSRRERDRFPW